MGIKFNKFKYHFLLIIALSLSYFNLVKEAENHFQEVDSVLSYDLLQDSDNQIIRYALLSYKPQQWSNHNKDENLKDITYYTNITPDFILDFLIKTDFFITNFEKISKNKFNFPSNADEMRLIIVDYFSRSNHESMPIHGLYRVGQSFLISKLPDNISPIFTYPLASTYTFGMAIYYQIIDFFSADFDMFVKTALQTNLLLLHIAAFFSFLTILGLGLKPLIASISVLILVFTASFYSYAFHMGSTLHTFVAFSACFYAFTKYNNREEKSLFKLGLFSSILLFYSYLIIIPLLAIYLHTFANFYFHSKKPFFKSIFLSLSLHKIPLILNLMCIIFFYQPGQGVRGEARGWLEYLDYIYLSILNLTGWANTGNELLNLMQFIFFGSIVLLGCFYFFRENHNNQKSLGLILIKYSLIIYILFLIFGLLNFAPTRHILFLQIFLVIFYSYAFTSILRNFNKSIILNISMIAIIVSIGIYTQNLRMIQTKSINFDFELLGKDSFIVSDVPRTISKKTTLQIINVGVEIESDDSFYFISQTTALNELDQKYLDKIVFEESHVKAILEIEDRYSFMPFSSPKFKDGRFAFNRGNGMYVYEINNK